MSLKGAGVMLWAMVLLIACGGRLASSESDAAATSDASQCLGTENANEGGKSVRLSQITATVFALTARVAVFAGI
jgi:hypothetical protein